MTATKQFHRRPAPLEELAREDITTKPVPRSIIPSTNKVVGIPKREIIDISQYRTLGRVGDGASSDVYKVQSPDGRIIAKKKLNLILSSDKKDFEKEVKRFLRQVEIMKYASNNTQMPEWVGVGLDSEEILGEFRPSLLMELIEGQALNHRFSEQVSAEYIRNVATSLIDPIEFLHKQNYLHRDIKPRNIIEDQSGILHLVDMGSARGRDGMTIDGTVDFKGTFGYIHPRVEGGGFANERTDLFSLGQVLRSLARGCDPSYDETIIKPGDIAWIRPQDEKLYNAILQMCDLDLDEGPQNTKELRQYLKEVPAIEVNTKPEPIIEPINTNVAHRLKMIEVGYVGRYGKSVNSYDEWRLKMIETGNVAWYGDPKLITEPVDSSVYYYLKQREKFQAQEKANQENSNPEQEDEVTLELEITPVDTIAEDESNLTYAYDSNIRRTLINVKKYEVELADCLGKTDINDIKYRSKTILEKVEKLIDERVKFDEEVKPYPELYRIDTQIKKKYTEFHKKFDQKLGSRLATPLILSSYVGNVGYTISSVADNMVDYGIGLTFTTTAAGLIYITTRDVIKSFSKNRKRKKQLKKEIDNLEGKLTRAIITPNEIKLGKNFDYGAYTTFILEQEEVIKNTNLPKHLNMDVGYFNRSIRMYDSKKKASLTFLVDPKQKDQFTIKYKNKRNEKTYHLLYSLEDVFSSKRFNNPKAASMIQELKERVPLLYFAFEEMLFYSNNGIDVAQKENTSLREGPLPPKPPRDIQE